MQLVFPPHTEDKEVTLQIKEHKELYFCPIWPFYPFTSRNLAFTVDQHTKEEFVKNFFAENNENGSGAFVGGYFQTKRTVEGIFEDKKVVLKEEEIYDPTVYVFDSPYAKGMLKITTFGELYANPMLLSISDEDLKKIGTETPDRIAIAMPSLRQLAIGIKVNIEKIVTINYQAN